MYSTVIYAPSAPVDIASEYLPHIHVSQPWMGRCHQKMTDEQLAKYPFPEYNGDEYWIPESNEYLVEYINNQRAEFMYGRFLIEVCSDDSEEEFSEEEYEEDSEEEYEET